MSDLTSKLATVLAQEVFIRSQGWSEWPTLDEIQADAQAIVAALGEATGFGGFDAWEAGTRALTHALCDAVVDTNNAHSPWSSLNEADGDGLAGDEGDVDR